MPKPADHQTAQNKQVVAGNTDTVALDNSGKTTVVLPRVTSDINGEKPESVKFLPQTGNEKNSFAIIALGAFTAMFGMNLVSRKRKF